MILSPLPPSCFWPLQHLFSRLQTTSVKNNRSIILLKEEIVQAASPRLFPRLRVVGGMFANLFEQVK